MKRSKDQSTPPEGTPVAEESDVVQSDESIDASLAGGESASTDESAADSKQSDEQEAPEEQVGFYVDRLQRLQAEFDNFRRRSQQELRDREERTTARIFRSVLSVVDDLRLAAQAEEKATDGVSEGLQIILDKVQTMLGEFSIEEIPAVGEPFDPAWHEAMIHQESEEVAPGSVVGELERGYRLRETLVRPARVIVAKGREG